jgi:hypothetical protein
MKIMQKLLVLTLLSTTLLYSCSKEPGSGGNSSVKGIVRGLVQSGGGSSDPTAEVTTVTITEGAVIEDDTYWLLNSPNGNLYYIWYEWTGFPGGDPALAGRTGIQVTYDYTQSNTTVASNTLAALQAGASSDFSFTLTGDIITIAANDFGPVADAENMQTPFGVDVAVQGAGGTTGAVTGVEGPMVEERVYLVYGDDDFYSESVRTDQDGNYQFKGLNKGKYTIYAFSTDTTNANGFSIQKEVEAEITKNKQVVEAEEIYIIK